MNQKRERMEQASFEAMCTENGSKSVIGNPTEENPKKILVFTAKWCGACKIRVPQILKKARAAGLKVELVDVDNADPKYRKMLRRVKFVPYIDYMGHEIEEDELDCVCQQPKVLVGKSPQREATRLGE